MSFVSNIMRQWVPISRFLSICAIIYDSREFVCNPNSIISSLAQFWSPVFDGSNSTFNSGRASAVLGNLTPSPAWNWSRLVLPDRRNFSSVIRNSKDKSPGFDGLPYSAHDSNSCISSVLMEHMFSTLRASDTPPFISV